MSPPQGGIRSGPPYSHLLEGDPLEPTHSGQGLTFASLTNSATATGPWSTLSSTSLDQNLEKAGSERKERAEGIYLLWQGKTGVGVQYV